MWRLLMAQGDELVAAVVECLREFGFAVQDMDGHHDRVTGAKLEDLRVTEPGDASWECLVEVKGYAKGARANDVSQVTGRPAASYAAETGHVPSAVWHIVNAYRAADPSSRPVALTGKGDLAPLTEADGALIDTRDLFAAWRAVTEHRVEASEVRASLRSARTRWIFDPNPQP